MTACIEQGITVTSIPGAAAVISALVTSGLATGRFFCFEGFLSVNKKQRRTHLEEIKDERRTMIFMKAPPHKLRATLQDLYDTLGDRRLSIARELTKKFEEICLMTLSQAIAKYADTPPKGEFALVIEGKTEEAAEDYSDLPIEAHVKLYTDGGMGEMDAMKAVAKDRGLRKNEVYAAVKENKKSYRFLYDFLLPDKYTQPHTLCRPRDAVAFMALNQQPLARPKQFCFVLEFKLRLAGEQTDPFIFILVVPAGRVSVRHNLFNPHILVTQQLRHNFVRLPY